MAIIMDLMGPTSLMRPNPFGQMISPQTLYVLRFGYGFRPGEPEPATAADLMAQLSVAAGTPPPVPVEGAAARLALMVDLGARLRARRKRGREEGRTFQRRYNSVMRDVWIEDIHAKLAHTVTSPHGFHERLVNFWLGHFAVSSKKVGPVRGLMGLFEATAIRPHVAGYFADMLWQVESHPAMLLYLDQHLSVGPGSAFGKRKGKGLNENLAREILELHTLGVNGGYTQDDVRQFAELLTGITLGEERTALAFRAQRAEPGSETVLGRLYGGGAESLDHIRAAIDDLARHPATARFVAWKLARHFVADDPPEALVRRMTQAFTASNGYLPALYEVMLDAPESAATFGAKIRQPLDFVVAGLRAVGADARSLAPRPPARGGEGMSMKAMKNAGRKRESLLSSVPLIRMNQPLWRPPGPDGWPEEPEYWITPQGLAERIRWATLVGRRYDVRDPRHLLEQSLREAVTPETLGWVSAAATKPEGVALALSSPEFNRR